MCVGAQTGAAKVTTTRQRLSRNGVGLNLPIEDWDELFLAVQTRLRLSAGAALDAAPMQGVVLECVDALGGLHTALRDERHLCEGMALELAAMHDALASARSVQADALTAHNGALFRVQLGEVLNAANAQRQAVTLLQLDIEGCDGIKVAHGSEVGEALLRIVAGRLARSVRVNDKLARLAEEQFACILVDVAGREQLSHLACKVLDAIAAPLQVRSLKLTVRPSIGIATCHDGESSPEALLRSAGAAASRARRGRSGYAFADELAEAWARRSALAATERSTTGSYSDR